MRLRLGGLAIVWVAASLTACGGGSVCDRTVDLTAKAGDCTGLTTAPLLGATGTCATRLMPCSDTDKNIIAGALDCLQRLTTCSAATQASWVQSQQGCDGQLELLAPQCKTSLFGAVLPGEDAGTDAGVDAGLQPIDDGGAGISFVAVADETSFAFAWVPLQTAAVATWELDGFDLDDGGSRLGDLTLPTASAPSTWALTDAGTGVSREWFLGGRTFFGDIALGTPDDGGAMLDAGAVQCVAHHDCPETQVCDLNQCQTLTCQVNATCPMPDYACNINVTPHICERTMGGNSGIDAGNGGRPLNGPLPMISNSWRATTGVPQFSSTAIGGFVAKRPALVAIDSARQFVAIEQSGELVGHPSISRGRDFVTDQTSVMIDTVGTNVKLAYNRTNHVLYACYTVGQGVRVRRSTDYGHSWGSDALDIVPVDDGGFSSSIGDCDLTAWKNDEALMVTVDDGSLVVRHLGSALQQLESPQVAFVSSPADGGSNIYFPLRPAIAALPDSDLVHIAFTANRIVGPITDTDIFGVYRDAQSGGVFSAAGFVDAPGGGNGSAQPQDYVTLAIDPVTHVAIAAWSSLEDLGVGSYSTVYLGFFTAQKTWVTGSDLSVFMSVVMNQNMTYPVFPQHGTDVWDAFSPRLAVMPDGRIWLSVLAGKRELSGANQIASYLVGFDLNGISPVGVGAKGWFRPPALQMSPTAAVDPRSGGQSVPATNSALAADSQISLYGAFVQGAGSLNTDDDRGVFVTRP